MKIQGEMILHAFNYLQRKRGSDGVEEVSRLVSFNLNDVHEEGWYPLQWYINTLDVITKTLNKEGFTVASRIGYDRSKKVGFLKGKKGEITPSWVYGKVKSNWPMFYSSGHIVVKENGDNSICLEIHEYSPHPLLCERTNGLLKGLLREVCGHKGGSVEEDICINTEGDCCRFFIKW